MAKPITNQYTPRRGKGKGIARRERFEMTLSPEEVAQMDTIRRQFQEAHGWARLPTRCLIVRIALDNMTPRAAVREMTQEEHDNHVPSRKGTWDELSDATA